MTAADHDFSACLAAGRADRLPTMITRGSCSSATAIRENEESGMATLGG
jgi:hypothetical protein